MSDERPEITRLLTEWRSKTEIKDFGDLGACFSHDGYTEQGFRPLRYSEKKLLELCADELEAALRASRPENWQRRAASEFVRDVIEALGKPQPPLDATVDLPAIAMEVVGQIEELKSECAALRASQEGRPELETGDLAADVRYIAEGCEPYSARILERAADYIEKASAPSEGVSPIERGEKLNPYPELPQRATGVLRATAPEEK